MDALDTSHESVENLESKDQSSSDDAESSNADSILQTATETLSLDAADGIIDERINCSNAEINKILPLSDHTNLNVEVRNDEQNLLTNERSAENPPTPPSSESMGMEIPVPSEDEINGKIAINAPLDEEKTEYSISEQKQLKLKPELDFLHKNGRYNLLEDIYGLIKNPDDILLSKLQKNDLSNLCEFCLAYAEDFQTLYHYHTHAIADRIPQKKCFCGEIRSNSERLKEHILSNHIMIVIQCEYMHNVNRPIFQTLRAYQVHVKKTHFTEYNRALNKSTNGYICLFCQNDNFIKGTQIEYLYHLTYSHSRILMELKLLRWPSEWGKKPIEALCETYNEVLDPKAAFLKNVIPSPAGVLPPSSSPSISFLSDDLKGGDFQASCFDSFNSYDLIRALLYLDLHREDRLMWKTFMDFYRIRYYCTFCRAFATGLKAKQKMEAHGRTHQDTEARIHSPYLCFCGSNYRDASALKEHILETHTKIILKCEYCSKSHLSLNSLSRHVREKHSDIIRNKQRTRNSSETFSCPFCIAHSSGTALGVLSHCVRAHFRLIVELSIINASTDPNNEQVLSFVSTFRNISRDT